MGNVNILEQIPIEYISAYLISIIFVSLIGIAITEWTCKRFDKMIAPLCQKISDRHRKIMERDKQSHKRK